MSQNRVTPEKSDPRSTSDCKCTPSTSYIAGSGWAETHTHDVRGPGACPTCACFGACEYHARRRARNAAWLIEYLGGTS